MKNIRYIIVSVPGLFFPLAASAHAFGQNYVLPLPAWMYIYGGGAVVVVSFLLIAYFTQEANPEHLNTSVDLSHRKFFSIFTNYGFILLLKLLGVLFLVVTVAAGAFGSQRPTENFAPTFFWITFLLGFTYLSAIVGGLWSIVNPWKTISSWLGDPKLFPYPKWLGYGPAVITYFILMWLELLSGGTAVIPTRLAMYLIFYTGLTIAGAGLFGIKDWFRYGDVFSVFFRLIGKLSPITYREGKLILRWPFDGLLEGTADRLSLLLFIILMLSSTAFDGFRETLVAYQISINFIFAQSYQAKQLILFIAIFLDFLAIYLIAIWLMRFLVKNQFSLNKLALIFAYSLIPIALAYNLAHYFTLFLVQGQYIFPALSDPFNLGWNLFGTANQTIKVGIMGAQTVWEFQVAFILIGHIVAVYIAHMIALRTFQDRRQAWVSQLPMLVVMVLYTMAGLWILSQPLTIV